MEFFAFIGAISFFIGTFYTIIYLDKRRDNKQEELKFFFKYNKTCQENWGSYDKALHNSFILEQIKDLMKNQKERQNASDNYKKAQEIKAQEIKEKRRKRKEGYKHEDDIFEVFRYELYLSLDQILQRIRIVCTTNDYEAKAKLKLWEEHNLVTTKYNNRQLYKIGDVLTYKGYSLDEDDLTYEKWLKINGIERDVFSY